MVKQGGTFFSLHKSKENILLHNSKQIHRHFLQLRTICVLESLDNYCFCLYFCNR